MAADEDALTITDLPLPLLALVLHHCDAEARHALFYTCSQLAQAVLQHNSGAVHLRLGADEGPPPRCPCTGALGRLLGQGQPPALIGLHLELAAQWARRSTPPDRQAPHHEEDDVRTFQPGGAPLRTLLPHLRHPPAHPPLSRCVRALTLHHLDIAVPDDLSALGLLPPTTPPSRAHAPPPAWPNLEELNVIECGFTQSVGQQALYHDAAAASSGHAPKAEEADEEDGPLPMLSTLRLKADTGYDGVPDFAMRALLALAAGCGGRARRRRGAAAPPWDTSTGDADAEEGEGGGVTALDVSAPTHNVELALARLRGLRRVRVGSFLYDGGLAALRSHPALREVTLTRHLDAVRDVPPPAGAAAAPSAPWQEQPPPRAATKWRVLQLEDFRLSSVAKLPLVSSAGPAHADPSGHAEVEVDAEVVALTWQLSWRSGAAGTDAGLRLLERSLTRGALEVRPLPARSPQWRAFARFWRVAAPAAAATGGAGAAPVTAASAAGAAAFSLRAVLEPCGAEFAARAVRVAFGGLLAAARQRRRQHGVAEAVGPLFLALHVHQVTGELLERVLEAATELAAACEGGEGVCLCLDSWEEPSEGGEGEPEGGEGWAAVLFGGRGRRALCGAALRAPGRVEVRVRAGQRGQDRAGDVAAEAAGVGDACGGGGRGPGVVVTLVSDGEEGPAARTVDLGDAVVALRVNG